MKLVHEIVARRMIDLVDREEQRLAGRAQLLGERVIDRGHAGAAVDDEHERVGLVDRAQRLPMDAGADHLALGFGIEAAGVDDAQLARRNNRPRRSGDRA